MPCCFSASSCLDQARDVSIRHELFHSSVVAMRQGCVVMARHGLFRSGISSGASRCRVLGGGLPSPNLRPCCGKKKKCKRGATVPHIHSCSGLGGCLQSVKGKRVRIWFKMILIRCNFGHKRQQGCRIALAECCRSKQQRKMMRVGWPE